MWSKGNFKTALFIVNRLSSQPLSLFVTSGGKYPHLRPHHLIVSSERQNNYPAAPVSIIKRAHIPFFYSNICVKVEEDILV